MTSKFTINNIKIINSWSYNTKFNDICIICRDNVNSESQSCIVIGECGHAFHYNCINPWIKTNLNCPMCNEKWVYKKN